MGSEVLEAPTRRGLVRLEVAPRHVVLEVTGTARVTVTDRFLTYAKLDKRRVKPRSLDLADRQLLVARAVPTDEVALWYEKKPGVMHRILELTPPELLDRSALEAWRELDRMYKRLADALEAHPAQEFGRGADRVLLEDRGDRDIVYVRPMFRERPRKAMEARGDGVVAFETRRGPEEVECKSRFGVTVHGDNINFSGPRGATQGHLWLPWIEEEDRKNLAKRLGERLDQGAR